MSYLGSWKIDDLLTFAVVTHRVDTGAATDADGAPSYRVYEDETSTPILTGTMALLDSGNTAGFYSEQITLSAANGLEKGKSYNIYIQATVNSVTGATVRSFQIEAEVDANIVSDAAGIRSAVGLSSANLDTQLTAIDDYLDTEIAAIKAKTDGLPSDPADASDIAAEFVTVNSKLDTIDDFLDLEIAAIKAKTDGLPTDPADASDIAAEFVTINTKLDTIDDFLDTEIAAIKTKTDGLPSDPADASDIAASFTTVNTKLDTIDDLIDTEVAAIKAKTDQLTFTEAGEVDANVQSINDTALTGNGSSTPWGPV